MRLSYLDIIKRIRNRESIQIKEGSNTPDFSRWFQLSRESEELREKMKTRIPLVNLNVSRKENKGELIL